VKLFTDEAKAQRGQAQEYKQDFKSPTSNSPMLNESLMQ
jgi:hypothetical protein